jgi:hypothetical protein
LPVQPQQRPEERRQAEAENGEADDNADDVRKAGQHKRDEPDEEHPKPHERDISEWSQAERRIDAVDSGAEAPAAEAVESVWQPRERP